MSSVDDLLGGIILALEQTKASVSAAETKFIAESGEYLPTLIKDLLSKTQSDLEGMSLLSLKNSSLLSYINNLVVVILAHLERINEDADTDKIEELKSKAVEGVVKQRVCLEKGVKPLEKKLTYQLDKMVRSYHRMEEDNAKMEAKINTQAEEAQDNESASDSESEDSSDEDEDALSYKPDASALAKMATKNSRKGKSESSTEDKYRPPKISAAAPPRATFDDRAVGKKPTRKLQSMEEYLAESSDLPQAESSIGATIVDHGRGGVKTSRDKQKEKEIQRYEESNFTRLPSTATKKTFKQKMAERANTFAGEDWSMFNNKRDLKDGTSRKRKAGTAWDRVKRRHA